MGFDMCFGQGADCPRPGSADFYCESAYQDAWSGPSQSVFLSLRHLIKGMWSIVVDGGYQEMQCFHCFAQVAFLKDAPAEADTLDKCPLIASLLM